MDDTISRQAVIDALEKCHKMCCREDDCSDKWIHYETTVNEIECIPSTQQETSILTVTVNPDSEEIKRAVRKIKDAPIMVLPSAEPERKKGKWINDEHDMPRCSECGYMPEYNKYIDDYYYSDFCPNCGAEMRGEQDE